MRSLQTEDECFLNGSLFTPLLTPHFYILRAICSSQLTSLSELMSFAVEVFFSFLDFVKYRRRIKIIHFTQNFVEIDTAKTIIMYLCIVLS